METKQEHYESMMQAITRYAPSTDLEVIQRAYEYADEKHKNQLRKSGEPYIIHPLAVAEIVAEIGLDTDAITAALLHDCLEDTDASFEEISRMFGETVANLVEGVTKLTRVQYSTMEEQQMENLRKMFMAMSKDIRVILIKIADRLHNTRTLQYQTPAKQISKSMETMEVYAPLAHRLGMQKIKWELEDTSLQYLDPEGYQEIIDYLKKNEDSANSFMNAIQSKITDRLASVGIHGSIYGRIKHTYSIYRKMRAQNKTIDELYDLYAFRVIVDNIADCYNVLGHIHDLFNPIPGRFKDYISTPKPNMYQSLHTTVIGSQGIPFEVQIRTWEMHQTAEYGIAAGRIAGASGVWIDPGKARPRKICAIGVRSSRYITMHGFALNVTTDLEWFSRINPCGFTDRGATSIERETGAKVPMDDVKRLVVKFLSEILNVRIYK